METDRVIFENVHYTYPDGKKAVRGVSFKVREGDALGIVGANGAGKSSLLHMLLGLILPSEGSVMVHGIEVNKKNLSKIRKKVGFTFQDSEDQLFMPRVYDDVAFGPRNYGLDESLVKERVETALERVAAIELIDRAPYKLSGGEKRSVAIATILAMEPEIIVMDEPTAALDPRARRNLINTLNNLDQMKIIATHDLDMILETCNKTIVLNQGQVIAYGHTEEILTNESLLRENNLEKPLMLQNYTFGRKGIKDR